GTVGLGIKESPNTPNAYTVVTIQGLPSYETITDNRDQMTFQGNLITLTGTEVNSGLTLTSNYQGAGHPSATLTITGNSFVNGVSSAMSAPQTIVVTDPTAATGTSNSVTSTVARPLAPTISIANPSLRSRKAAEPSASASRSPRTPPIPTRW